VRGQAPVQVPPPAPANLDFDSFGARDLGDSAFDDPTALELDDVVPARPSAARQPSPQAPQAQGHAATPPRSTLNAAVGSTVPKDANPNVLTALQELSGFGDPPTGWVSSGRYAIHVARRLWALRRERKVRVRELARAEEAHRGALEGLAEAMIGNGTARVPALKDVLGPVEAARDQVSQADQSLSQAREQARDALAQLDRTREGLLQELAPFVDAERAAQAAVKRAEDDLKRGQAWLKRVEIELRALDEAEAAPMPAKLAELEAQREQRSQAAAGFQATLETLQAKLAQAQHELAQRKQAVDAVDEQRRALQSGAQAKESAIGQQTQAASDSYRNALRGLAEAARQRGLTGQAAPAEVRVEESLVRLEEARSAVGMIDRARDLYDHAGVRNGVVLFVVLIVLGTLALMLHTGAEPG
jgi:hypothetical protein